MATGGTPSAKEKTNLVKLSRLVTEYGRRVFQFAFDAIHPPANLQAVLNSPAVQTQLRRLRPRVLHQQQWDILYPASGIVESKNFDITLLFLLLRNICGLAPPPSTGHWDKEPLPSDLSQVADLVRIKKCRNELYAHRVQMAMTDDEFDENWDYVTDALNRLSALKYKDQIGRLKFASVDYEKDTCFYILLQSWEEGESFIQKLDENIANGNDKIVNEIRILNSRLNNLPSVREFHEILQKIQEMNGNVSERELNKASCNIPPVDPEESATLEQVKNLLTRLEAITKELDDSSTKRREILNDPKGSNREPEKDISLFSTKLKKLIIKRTDKHQVGIIDAKQVKTDDIFTNLVLYHGTNPQTSDKKLAGKMVTKLENCSEIFIGEEGEENPKRILVSGDPGIGKTMFSHKLVRDVAVGSLSIPNVKILCLVHLRQLNNCNQDINLKDLMNLCTFYNDSTKIDEAIIKHIIENQQELLLVFDGFDEFDQHENTLNKDYEIRFPNNSTTKMPVAALLSKIFKKKILEDSLVMVTSRPREVDKLDKNIFFDKMVKINGFSESQIFDYVNKYFSSYPEEFKKKALEKVKATMHYLAFGSTPFLCYLMCRVVESEIKNQYDNSAPIFTLTQFYHQIIRCIEQNYNRQIASLNQKAASLAVDSTLDNFAKLAALLVSEKRYIFTTADLDQLKLTANESIQITSSNLLCCSFVYSNSPLETDAICEYSFVHYSIQEFFVAWHLVKMANPMVVQETTEMVKIFTSGLLGLQKSNVNDRIMCKLLSDISEQDYEFRRRVMSLRCLYEYGQDKKLTRQEILSNKNETYWTRDGNIVLADINDTDCYAVKMLVDISNTVSKPPHGLAISLSGLTCTGLQTFLPVLAHKNCKITNLRLNYCQMDNECVACLSQYLCNSHVTKLDLSGNSNICDVGICHLASSFLSQLTELDLSHNTISDDGVCHIFNNHIPYLAILKLSFNKISDVGVGYIVCNIPPHLTDIDLSYNNISNECKKTTKKLLKNKIINVWM